MPTKLFDLKGRVALITGASRGIGEATARLLAEQGAHVVLSSRKQADLDAVAASIIADGGEASAIAAHQGDSDALAQLISAIDQRFGRLDILVNNAATNPHFGHISDTPMAMVDKTLQVNVKGYFELAALASKLMRRNGKGAIVNIASITFNGGWGDFVPYVHSKGAIVGMTRSMARELGPFNIRVNAISPGAIPTELERQVWAHKLEEYTQFILDHQSLKRRIEPQEIAQTVHYLCCEASSGITGQNLSVDGGWWMH